MDSYLDKDLDPLCRIEKLWYVVFFMRYWRKWLMLNSKYTLRENFITSNAFACIELNAHALLTFLITVRDHVGNDDCFLPWLLGSQCCESTFRTARSMNSTFSTTINFGILGLLRRLHRLHIQLTLQAEAGEDIVFPRVTKHQRKCVYKPFSLSEISNDKILETVQKAQDSAKFMVEELGMDILFKKHSMWAPDVTIFGIDGGILDSTFDGDDGDDSDIEDNDETDNLDSQDIGEEETCTNDAVEISNDLKTIFTHDLVDSTLEQRLQLRQKLLFERLPSSTIPMY